MILVLLSGLQLAVHVGPAHVLTPGVYPRARGWFDRFQGMTVDPVSGAIVFPEDVIVTIGREHHSGARLLPRGVGLG